MNGTKYIAQEENEMDDSMTTIEIDRLIDWLKANGFTAEQAAECIKYIANDKEKDRQPRKA